MRRSLLESLVRARVSISVIAADNSLCADEVLLNGKKYRHVMEPINVRTGKVEAFLARFKPSLRCDAVPIADVYGPTASDPNIQALIVSYETLSGAASSNPYPLSLLDCV